MNYDQRVELADFLHAIYIIASLTFDVAPTMGIFSASKLIEVDSSEYMVTVLEPHEDQVLAYHDDWGGGCR